MLRSAPTQTARVRATRRRSVRLNASPTTRCERASSATAEDCRFTGLSSSPRSSCASTRASTRSSATRRSSGNRLWKGVRPSASADRAARSRRAAGKDRPLRRVPSSRTQNSCASAADMGSSPRATSPKEAQSPSDLNRSPGRGVLLHAKGTPVARLGVDRVVAIVCFCQGPVEGARPVTVVACTIGLALDSNRKTGAGWEPQTLAEPPLFAFEGVEQQPRNGSPSSAPRSTRGSSASRRNRTRCCDHM